jgi:hypothetical protein
MAADRSQFCEVIVLADDGARCPAAEGEGQDGAGGAMPADPSDARRSMGRSIASGQRWPCDVMAADAVSISSNSAAVRPGSAAA